MAQYRLRVKKPRLTLQVNVDSVFDTKWYAGVYKNSRNFIVPGMPRRFQVMARLDFWGGE